MTDTGPHVKVWVGNIDNKLTEYQLLKICEKFGEVSDFDFLYNISDTGHRTPRGYAFLTYTTASFAATAIDNLNGKKILSRELVVRYANPKSDYGGITHHRPVPAALKAGRTSDELSSDQKARKIQALEAKLKLMEKSSNEEFKLQSTSSSGSKSRHKPYSR